MNAGDHQRGTPAAGAEQLINGAIIIVVSRSRRFSITRVAITPGIAQANDDSSGMNDLPLKARTGP